MRKQQGMTVIGMLMSLAVVVILGVLIIQVVPVYLQHHSVTSSVSGLRQIPASDFNLNIDANIVMLKKSLEKRLNINGVDDMVRSGVKIKAKGQYTYQVTVKYQVIKPLIYNVSLLFNFDDTQEVRVGKS